MSFCCCKPRPSEDLPYVHKPSPSKSSRRWLRRFGAPNVSLALISCASLLIVAWLVVVAFIVNLDTLSHKYTFEPRSITTFNAWGTTSMIIVSAVIPLAGFLLASGENKTKRWTLHAVCAFAVAMLVSGNILGAKETSKRENFEQQFAVKFNDFYCDTRTLKVCLEGSRADLLLLTRGNVTAATSTANASSDDAALSIWERCREVLLEGMAEEAKRDKAEGDEYEEGEKEVETKPLYKFLSDCKASLETDVWCGNVLQRKTSLTDQEQRTLPAPHAMNPQMFKKYTREWSKSMFYSNILLGAALGCMLLALLSLKAQEHDF